MSKISISDPTIRVKPGNQLRQFIASINEPVEMPETILEIYKSCGGDSTVKHTQNSNDVAMPIVTQKDLDLLSKLSREEIGGDVQTLLNDILPTAESDESKSEDEDILNIPPGKPLSKTQLKRNKEKQKQNKLAKLVINLNDIKWLNAYLVERRKNDPEFKQYLHELLSDAELVLPQNEVRQRNPELEKRCVQLRLEQEARVYNAMTRNVTSSRNAIPDDTIAFQMKQINRHLIAVLQFLFSVAAGFAFGFIGVELIVGGLDFGFRLLLGIMCALVIALAEIYFLAKQLNEEFDLTVPKEQLLKPSGVQSEVVRPAKGTPKEHDE